MANGGKRPHCDDQLSAGARHRGRPFRLFAVPSTALAPARIEMQISWESKMRQNKHGNARGLLTGLRLVGPEGDLIVRENSGFPVGR